VPQSPGKTLLVFLFCCAIFFSLFDQKKPWFFPKDEEKAHLAEICPKMCRRCEICRADLLKSEYDAHMKEAVVLHMSFMMTRVVVRFPPLFVLFPRSLLIFLFSGFGKEAGDRH
jgi:hypothetical protein